MSSLRILALSDLHAYNPKDPKLEALPSHLPIDIAGDGQSNPLKGLLELIQRESLTVDLTVCCGDIGDRADPSAVSWTWDWLRQIANVASGGNLRVVSGNHDMDSRNLNNKHDARGLLLGLQNYPFEDRSLVDAYWARNLVVETFEDYRLVSLNSAAHHGFDDEWQHGRISDRTLAELRKQLAASPNRDRNVLICHHHLYPFSNLDPADESQMKGSSALVELLGSGEFGRWLILHGHKHWPFLGYAPGPATSPVVFSIGSFSAVLYPELQSRARNQVYEIELLLDDDASAGCGLAGRFRAWDWISQEGWQPAQWGSGLPSHGGFGNRQGGDVVGKAIAALIKGSGKPVWRWEAVLASDAAYGYLLPSDLAQVRRQLLAEGLTVFPDTGPILEIGATT